MILFRINTQVRVPVRLETATGVPATGVVNTDVLNSTIKVVKADGTTASVSLVNGSNWWEIDATNAPGLYHLQLPSGALSAVGPVQWALVPAGSAKFAASGFIGSGTVEDLPTLILAATVSGLTLGTVGGVLRLFDRFIRGRVKQTTSNPAQRVVYAEDGTTPLATVNTLDNTGAQSYTSVFETHP